MWRLLGGYFDIESKKERLEEINKASESDSFWSNVSESKKISQEKTKLEKCITTYEKIKHDFIDLLAGLELYSEVGNVDFLVELEGIYKRINEKLSQLEFVSKMSGKFDSLNAILEINAGAGGTEAQDWALMLLRMYTRWAEKRGFKCEEMDRVYGEVAGIKSVMILIKGDYSYGFLRGEQGVHRLVRISPFDSGQRRHTSFAAVAVMPDIEEEISIDVDEKDLRIDTYRSSGAGGQHVNTTDSAVRITHIPTGMVVTCQNERSQYKNKDQAMKVLKARLYELEERKNQEKLTQIQGEKNKIDFGSQIRNYVLHPYKMVKDTRTNYETSNAEGVLDGDLDQFMDSYLQKQAGVSDYGA